MAANYPSSLPVKDAAGATLATNPHSTLHDGMYDEIVAIGTELGTLPKGTYATVKARLDAMPAGSVGTAQITANQIGITTVTDITGLTVTWTASSSRLYRTTIFLGVQANTTDNRVVAYITDSSNVTKQRCFYEPVVDTGAQFESNLSVVETGLTGSVTRKVRLARNTGTGGLSVLADATFPAYILVEDIGLA